MRPTYRIPTLPLPGEIETKPVLKAAGKATRALSQMRAEAARVPNQSILIDMLFLQEAQASSEIENIVTTQDELFEIGPDVAEGLRPAQKEVALYRDALFSGFEEMRRLDGAITNNALIGMFRILKGTDAGYRPGPGTVLRNDATGEVVSVPPQSHAEIQRHMSDLERFANAEMEIDWDPLVAMAVIHHQFESIHPFTDGNGRVGRMLNALYLVKRGLLDVPILYHSRYINQNKADYYATLQHVRDTGEWEPFLIYMIRGVELTAAETRGLLSRINGLLASYKARMRRDHARAYSHELLNALFRFPYTRIDYVERSTGVSRPTATRNLDELAAAGFVTKERRGRAVYYINVPLVEIFLDRPRMG